RRTDQPSVGDRFDGSRRSVARLSGRAGGRQSRRRLRRKLGLRAARYGGFYELSASRFARKLISWLCRLSLCSVVCSTTSGGARSTKLLLPSLPSRPFTILLMRSTSAER